MKEKITNYIGLDISAGTIDAGIFKIGNPVIASKEPFINEIGGFEDIQKWLASNRCDVSNSVICLEVTGVYSEAVCYYFHEKGYTVWAEAPHKVHRAFYRQVKNDKVSAMQIAEYSYRFLDQMIPFQPKENIIEEVRTLLATREQLVGQLTANKNILHAFNRKKYSSNTALKVLNESIENMKKSIIELDKELKKIIYDNPKYSATANALDSIPGISMLFVANLFAITNRFQKECNYKNLASYIGICPHEHKSGTSVFKKPTSSGFGPNRFRKLLYLAAMSVRQHNPKFYNYFLLKQQQGKNDKLILNNIANKLIKIVCGILKNNCSFNPKYVSVHPNLLKVI